MAKKVVLVTGASRGIGKAIAIKFAKKGYNVIINCAHRERELLQAQKEISSYQVGCTAFLGDMGKMEDCEKLFALIRKQYGSLDVLVNNAGVDYIGLLQDMTSEDWDRIIRTNLTSVFNCCKLAIPMMLSAGSGKIVNISSVWGNRSFLRGCLLRNKGWHQCIYPRPRKRTCTEQHSGQRCCLRSDRHGDESVDGGRRDAPARR